MWWIPNMEQSRRKRFYKLHTGYKALPLNHTHNLLFRVSVWAQKIHSFHVSKVNVMTKEKDEEQLADILLFTVAIKSLVTYRKGEERFISSGQGEEGRELCSRGKDWSKGLEEGTGLQPDMQTDAGKAAISPGNHGAHQKPEYLVVSVLYPIRPASACQWNLDLLQPALVPKNPEGIIYLQALHKSSR